MSSVDMWGVIIQIYWISCWCYDGVIQGYHNINPGCHVRGRATLLSPGQVSVFWAVMLVALLIISGILILSIQLICIHIRCLYYCQSCTTNLED